MLGRSMIGRTVQVRLAKVVCVHSHLLNANDFEAAVLTLGGKAGTDKRTCMSPLQTAPSFNVNIEFP